LYFINSLIIYLFLLNNFELKSKKNETEKEDSRVQIAQFNPISLLNT